MKDKSVDVMLDEIAGALRSGDEGVLHWLRDQLELSGASEVSMELTLGLIVRLMPEEADGGDAAMLRPLAHRRLH